MPNRYMGWFEPQILVNGEVIEVDTTNNQDWVCTQFFETHPEWVGDGEPELQERLEDGEEILDRDNLFLQDPAAPDWIREWAKDKPFSLWIRIDNN